MSTFKPGDRVDLGAGLLGTVIQHGGGAVHVHVDGMLGTYRFLDHDVTLITCACRGLSSWGTGGTHAPSGCFGGNKIHPRLPGVVHEVSTQATIRIGECPCGGTWGVCTYHGGEP